MKANIAKLEAHEVDSFIEHLISLTERMLPEMKIYEAVELTLPRQQQNGGSIAAGSKTDTMMSATVVKPDLVKDNGLTAIEKLVTWKLDIGCQIIMPKMT